MRFIFFLILSFPLCCWCGLTFISGERYLYLSLNPIQVMILMIRVIVKLPQAVTAYL
jgi:hypothetical protein